MEPLLITGMTGDQGMRYPVVFQAVPGLRRLHFQAAFDSVLREGGGYSSWADPETASPVRSYSSSTDRYMIRAWELKREPPYKFIRLN